MVNIIGVDGAVDGLYQGGRSKRRTHGGNKCKHTRARDVTRDNLAKNSLGTDADVKWFLSFVKFFQGFFHYFVVNP